MCKTGLANNITQLNHYISYSYVLLFKFYVIAQMNLFSKNNFCVHKLLFSFSLLPPRNVKVLKNLVLGRQLSTWTPNRHFVGNVNLMVI